MIWKKKLYVFFCFYYNTDTKHGHHRIYLNTTPWYLKITYGENSQSKFDERKPIV